MRKWFKTLLLLLCFTCLLAAPAAATETEATETEQGTATAAFKPGIKTKDGKFYLYDKTTGKNVKGLKGVQEYPAGSGKYYYFINKLGRIYTQTWIKKGTSYYYANKNGQLAKGLKKVGGKYYFFRKKTLERYSGWIKYDSKWHYFNAEGVRVKKWLKWKGHTYYLDPKDGAAKSIGMKQIGNYWYYFNKRGRMQTGWVTVNGKKYYMNTKGVRISGLARIGGKTYFFGKKYGVMRTGWTKTGGKRYYMSKTSGAAVTGWMTLSGARYYFNSSGVMQKGLISVAGKQYYLTSEGKLVTGKKNYKINGVAYNIDSNGVATPVAPTGAWSIKVNQNTCVVTVYRGNTPVKAMLCSVGLNGATPDGVRYITDKIQWHTLGSAGHYVYGQYCSHLAPAGQTWSSYLFHSVYYTSYRNNYSLATDEFRKLGQPASAGCIRLSCGSAYYIWQNCPVGTKVTIFHGSASDDPLGRPSNPYANWTGSYDPTDPVTND